ncbi:MAG: hypothetical protein GX654_21845 [Desulfatiglans sp.]|nr:hypothetical protein [Desulfatiglans sp.]
MYNLTKVMFSGFRKIKTYHLPKHTVDTRLLSFKYFLRDLCVLRGNISLFTDVSWKLLCPILLLITIVHAAILPAQENIKAENTNWLSEANINISEPGMIETTLPPGMHHIPVTELSRDSGLDLTLLGPDNRERPFELFWTERGDMQVIGIEASTLKLDNLKRLIWEGITPDNFIVKKIMVGISDKNYIGKVDIEGLTSSGWRMLATDVALYRAAGDDRAIVDIQEGEYERLRLSFSGYDIRFREIPAFVEKVEIKGEVSKRGYIEEVITPEIEKINNDDSTEIRITLPGTGIYIEKIFITTSSMFRGSWQLGWDTISMGEQHFMEIRTGECSFTGNENPSIMINLGMQSRREAMIIRLKSAEYFGEIRDVSITARLPRMVFFAEREGAYTLKTGAGKKAHVKEMRSGKETGQHQLIVSAPIINPAWQPEQIPDDTVLRGGPFNDEGYTWRSGIHIERPGFYRLVLDNKAGLEANRQGLRIVKDGMQVPCFFGRREERKIDIGEKFEYDRSNNRSIMPLTLPSDSGHIRGIRLTGKGIFKRELIIETEQPGRSGWQRWLKKEWINTRNETSHFDISINELPWSQSAMRLIIDHGDNQPVLPEKIEAVYDGQDLFFLAGKSGEYMVTGGNPKAKAASYDLAIIQDFLFNRVPEKIMMNETESIHDTKWSSRLSSLFSEKGWGLYGVLGLVTLVLLIIIVRLFPRK